MSYYRADTTNSQGWRPGTLALGAVPNGPNYQVSVARRNAQIGALRQWRTNGQRAQMSRDIAVDAAARGVALPVRRRRALSGLGLNAINLNGKMVAGFPYVFHFSWSGLGLAPDMNAISAQIAQDSNFSSPVASAESGGVQVSFTYSGQGSNVAQAGAEMQNVIDTFGLMGVANGLTFYAAEGGPVTQTPSTQPATVTLPDGTQVQVNQTTAPGTPPSPSSSGFSWSGFLTGLGLSVGVGTALAVGLGVILLKD